MKILLVNDDGYDAIGIQQLYHALRLRHEVTIIAPLHEHSGAGHSVTLRHPIRVCKREHGFAVDGTPADCVKVGVNCLTKDCDLVVSGINPGANLGVDVNYSGTASAAREAAIQGKRALAASCYCREFKDIAYLAQLTAETVECVLQKELPAGTMVNLNMPNLTRGDALQWDTAPLGWFIYQEKYDLQPTENPDEYVFMPFYGEKTCAQGHYDINLVRENRICLTTVSWDGTNHAAMHLAQEIADEMKECRK